MFANMDRGRRVGTQREEYKMQWEFDSDVLLLDFIHGIGLSWDFLGVF